MYIAQFDCDSLNGHEFFGRGSDAPPKPGPRRYHEDGWMLPDPATEALRKYRDSLTEETCCSFVEWQDAGYRIRKGARSMFKDMLGIPQFTKEQVWKA